jgi:HD-GYP domain-containing protein (c-di-GMP phosphodiesterase class II)
VEPIDPNNSRDQTSTLRERFQAVTRIGLRMTRELDLDSLLELVLSESRRLTRSDAGSLWVREGDVLAFKLAQNDSTPEGARSIKAFSWPIDEHSLLGLAAFKRETLKIDDVQHHPSHARSAASAVGYPVHTMLVVPMRDHRDRVLGVLQLLNALDDRGRPVAFDPETAYLCEVLASHAATALEVARLYRQVTELLEAMVLYTAKAIDARDPATAGHSGRVSKYAVALGRHLGMDKAQLKELKFAALFHDVGKIGVPEAILTKRNKLSDEALAAIAERFEAARRAHEVEVLSSLAPQDSAQRGLEAARRTNAALDEQLEFVRRMAVPGVMSGEDLERLRALRDARFTDAGGASRSLITEDEYEALSVRRGNLTDAERTVMQSHVSQSRSMLARFPFPPELARVVDYVGMHHEKFDGSGYPDGLAGEDVPLGARIIAVVDAFDALTAQDRPYKKGISVTRSLEILSKEAQAGYWDPAVVKLLSELIESNQLKVRQAGEEG